MAVTLDLPLVLVDGVTARCTTCGEPCPGTLRGPGERVPFDDDGGVYTVSDGDPYCQPCHVVVIEEYRAAVRLRKALYVLARKKPGARNADALRVLQLAELALRSVSDGVQVPLFPEIRP